MLTVITYGDVWSLVEMERCSATTHCGSGIAYQNSLLQLHGVVSNSSFIYVMLLAAVLRYCGYRRGVKKEQ